MCEKKAGVIVYSWSEILTFFRKIFCDCGELKEFSNDLSQAIFLTSAWSF